MAKTIVTLVSPAISCNHCVEAIKSGLQGTPGIESVEVDKDNKMVTVTYDVDYLSEADVRHKMRDIGYEVLG